MEYRDFSDRYVDIGKRICFSQQKYAFILITENKKSLEWKYGVEIYENRKKGSTWSFFAPTIEEVKKYAEKRYKEIELERSIFRRFKRWLKIKR